jgi:ABC-type amino acid transport substrate-binding protein
MPVYSLLTEEYYAWGIRIENTDLMEKANTFLDHLNTKGRLNPIIHRWIPLADK